jgi:hypothetical protein
MSRVPCPPLICCICDRTFADLRTEGDVLLRWARDLLLGRHVYCGERRWFEVVESVVGGRLRKCAKCGSNCPRIRGARQPLTESSRRQARLARAPSRIYEHHQQDFNLFFSSASATTISTTRLLQSESPPVAFAIALLLLSSISLLTAHVLSLPQPRWATRWWALSAWVIWARCMPEGSVMLVGGRSSRAPISFAPSTKRQGTRNNFYLTSPSLH